MKSPQLTPKNLTLSLLMLCTVCLAGAAAAQPSAAPFDPARTIEQWSQVLYCQQAFAHPENKTRVYGYDIEQCSAAEAYLLGQIALFPDTVKADMKKLAQRQANRVMSNTRDITQVLAACRQTCTSMAKLAPTTPAQPTQSAPPAKPDDASDQRP